MTEQHTNINNIITSAFDEYNPDKLHQVFAELDQIKNYPNKTLRRKLQLMHNHIVALRKDFDPTYKMSTYERNKELSRMRYHEKKEFKSTMRPEDL